MPDSRHENEKVMRVEEPADRIFKVKKRVKASHKQRGQIAVLPDSVTGQKSSQQKYARNSRPASAISRERNAQGYNEERKMGQHLCQDENTFGSAVERFQSEANLVKDLVRLGFQEDHNGIAEHQGQNTFNSTNGY